MIGEQDPADNFTDPGRPRSIILPDPLRELQGKFTGADRSLGLMCCVLLDAHYPGWPWSVDPNHGQGIVTLRCGVLSGKSGIIIKLSKTSSPAEWRKAIIDAAGEILERFGCKRGRMTWDELAHAKADHTVMAEWRAEKGLKPLSRKAQMPVAFAKPALIT